MVIMPEPLYKALEDIKSAVLALYILRPRGGADSGPGGGVD